MTLSLLLCLGLIAIIITGKRRARWLIGLAALLGLLEKIQRFPGVLLHALAISIEDAEIDHVFEHGLLIITLKKG